MKKLLLLIFLFSSFRICAQTYTQKDFVGTLKTFSSQMVFLEAARQLTGNYDTVITDGNYYWIVLQGEIWNRGTHFGKLYQCISFDGRDISEDIKVEPITDPTGSINRWDVVIKVKNDKTLIHFKNEQVALSNNTHYIRVHQDVSTINFMFVSLDAANRFKLVCKALFK